MTHSDNNDIEPQRLVDNGEPDDDNDDYEHDLDGGLAQAPPQGTGTGTSSGGGRTVTLPGDQIVQEGDGGDERS